MVVKSQKIVYKLHDRRKKIAPSIELRRAYLRSTFAQQVRSEKEAISSKIDRMAPATKKVYLARLKHLEEQSKNN